MIALRIGKHAGPVRQQGVALVVGMMMLVIITIIVLGAYSLSTSNAKSVGNMQVRKESIAAANMAVEKLISSPFTNSLGAQSFDVDINMDGVVDYVVNIAVPVCQRAIKASDANPSDVELGADMSSGADWFTDWDIDARVSDVATGADIRVRQGVRVMLDETKKSTVCP